jgi:hypothetical protein
MRAKAHDGHDRKQRERARGARRHPHTLAHSAWREHNERQHQPGGCLHAHADHKQRRGGAKIGSPVCLRRPHLRGACLRRVHRRGTRREQQRAREHQQHERIVVRSPHRQLERHRVQAHECCRPLRRASHPLRGARNQRHRAQAGGHRDRLQRPQATRQTERRERIGGERKQRAVGGVLKRPPDERKHGVGGRFGGHMRIWVQAMQHAQPRKRQVAEHVLGDQRRPQQQHHVRRHDRRGDRPAREHPRGEQHRHIARAHRERQCLEAARADPKPKAVQRAIQPRRPAAAASRHVLRGSTGRAGCHAKHAYDRAEESDESERAQSDRGARRVARGAASVLRGRYAVHVAVPPEHPSPCARPSRIVRQMGKA